MVWRRLLVPMSYTLHELHGVLQAAMGWEGLHLFELKVRGVGYGSFDLHLKNLKILLESFGFRKRIQPPAVEGKVNRLAGDG